MDKKNRFHPALFKKTFEADIHLHDGTAYTHLQDKKVNIYQGARGIQLLEIDNALYPVRTFKDDIDFKVEKKYSTFMSIFIVFAGLLFYIQWIWIINLQTNENYWNPVTIITMVIAVGLAIYAMSTLTKQRVYHLFLKKVKKEWHQLHEVDDYDFTRTIIKNKGFGSSALLAALFSGFTIAFLVSIAILSTSTFALLDSADQTNQWVVLNSEEAARIVSLYHQTRNQLQIVFIIDIVICVFLVLSWLVSIIGVLRSKKQEKPLVYTGDLLNYNPKTGKFKLVDYYFDPYEGASQKDVDTLDAAVIAHKNKEKLTIRPNPESEEVEALGPLIFEDEHIVRNLTLEDARKLIIKTHDDLDESYEGRIVKDIVDEQNRQIKSSIELCNFLAERGDALEAELEGLKSSLSETYDRYEDLQILHAGSPELKKKKKPLDPLHITLIVLLSIFAIICVVLIMALTLSTNSGVTV